MGKVSANPGPVVKRSLNTSSSRTSPVGICICTWLIGLGIEGIEGIVPVRSVLWSTEPGGCCDVDGQNGDAVSLGHEAAAVKSNGGAKGDIGSVDGNEESFGIWHLNS